MHLNQTLVWLTSHTKNKRATIDEVQQSEQSLQRHVRHWYRRCQQQQQTCAHTFFCVNCKSFILLLLLLLLCLRKKNTFYSRSVYIVP